MIDITSGDMFGVKKLFNEGPGTTFALLKANLVDMLETDYMGGYWDPILLFLQEAVEAGVIDLPKAIALATSNVVKHIPRAAPNRGFIAPNKVADIAIVNHDRISEVETVIIGGRLVVENGKIVVPIEGY